MKPDDVTTRRGSEGIGLRYFFILSSAFFISVSFFGCAGYHVGNASLFPADIHTVFVPMFESDSFRRDLGEQL
ncbi:MAG TPA: hypothetical protein VKB78_12600, partial [Pirellulales bacterium]|nr:hypothetical protein [Pirellulales bacterium]